MSSDPQLAPAGRLERHTLALGLVTAAVSLALVVLAGAAIRGFPFGERWPVRAVVPVDGPPLREGDEVRVAGVRFGEVRTVEPDRYGTAVAMELDHGPIGAGARVRVRVRGLSAVPYVDLDRGDLSRPAPPGSTIPRAQTAASAELVDVLDVFDPPTRAALRRVAPTLGGGVEGRGPDINASLTDLEPALRGATPLFRAVSPRSGALRDAAFNARVVLRALAPPDSRELEVLLPDAASTAEGLASRSSDIEETVRLMPVAEDEAHRTLPPADAALRDARATLVELRPGLRSLRDALPSLDRLLRSEEGLRSAGRLGLAAKPVLAESRPLLIELRPVTAALDPLLDALGPLVAKLSAYGDEIRGAARGLRTATARRYAAGAGPPRRAIRSVPVLTCHRARDPYPAPDEARRQRQACQR
jgi:phospholipid/cholesterol/gamma-HCH transport system substrate-binding protein